MAKMLKQLVFGQKKNPPAPPRPDYEGNKSPPNITFESQPEVPFFDHDYENIPKFKSKTGSQVRFSEKKEQELVVFDNYSEPADLRAEIAALEEADPLYMSPVDDQGGTAPPPPDDEEEEDMYCLPYDTPQTEEAPALPTPCLSQQGRLSDENGRPENDDTYDVVPDVSPDDDDHDDNKRDEECAADEYDEPWEWSVGARLTTSLQVSPSPSLDGVKDLAEDEDEEMTARQQRRLLYETAFDSRVRRDADDLDRLMQQQQQQQQSPLFMGRSTSTEGTPVARAASRSSFGSTSGSSASSTPTHQPMEIARHSPRPFTPTERRRVTLVRDSLPRSMSPQARSGSGLRGAVVNQNYERKISLQWDNVSRSSGSDRSSSQESMNVEVTSSRGLMGRSASRDSLNDRRITSQNYPNNWRELTNATTTRLEPSSKTDLEKEEEANQDSFRSKNSVASVKVLPVDNSSNTPRFSKITKSCSKTSLDLNPDPELKENNAQVSPQLRPGRQHRHSSLLSEVRPMDNLPQSPENDNRTSEDYDPPWDFKTNNVLRVNGSISVPERLSTSTNQPIMTTSITHDQLDAEETKDRPGVASNKPKRPNGPPARPNLNLNLNLNSDSPRKARQNLTLNFGCAALSAVGEKVDPQLTLEKQGWYHGSISRVDAEGKLRVLKEGSYLVRNSESSKQDYSLSLKSARGFMHMKIVPTSEGRFILGQFSNPFSSIPEMIQHYSVNKLPIKGAEHMSLLYPVIDQLL